jgi:hypothetical protein
MATLTLKRVAGRRRTETAEQRAHTPVGSAVTRRERPLWQILVVGLVVLGVLIAAEIALAFGVARLVTGHAY